MLKREAEFTKHKLESTGSDGGKKKPKKAGIRDDTSKISMILW